MRRVAVGVAVAFLLLLAIGSSSGVKAQSGADFRMGDYLPPGCAVGYFESRTAAASRCNAEDAASRARAAEDAGARAENARRMRELIADLRARPALPAAQNRLLGRWQAPRQAAGRGAPNDPFSALLQGLTSVNMCGLLFGGGEVEFGLARWASTDAAGRDDLGAVAYRGGADGTVAVMPAQGFQLLVFQVLDANRARLVGDDNCVLTRVGGPVQAARPPAAAPTPSSARATQVAAARAVQIVTWDDDRMGYQCPGGVRTVVLRCLGPGAGAGCQVQQAGLPGRGAAEVHSADQRGALAEKLAACRPVRVGVDDRGGIVFPP